MNYAAFERMQTGALSRLENEPEQDYMTRVFREICRCDGFCGPDTTCSEHRINDMLAPTLIACSAEEQTLELSFHVRGWMCNPKGTFHGGMMATMRYDDGNAHALLPEDKCGLYSQLVP